MLWQIKDAGATAAENEGSAFTVVTMHTSAVPPAIARLLTEQLLRRQDELRSVLQTANGALGSDAPGDVRDFKDVAAEDTRAVIDEAAHAHAAGELARIGLALHRVRTGTYGECEDCGEAIDERRLQALPATTFCTDCQAIHERPARLR